MSKEEEELKKVWLEDAEQYPSIPIEHPTIGELGEALGYKTIYDALKATVKEKGLWKKEWNEK